MMPEWVTCLLINRNISFVRQLFYSLKNLIFRLLLTRSMDFDPKWVTLRAIEGICIVIFVMQIISSILAPKKMQ